MKVLLLPGLDGTGQLFRPLMAAAPDGIEPIPVTYPADLCDYEQLERAACSRLTDDCVLLAESFSGPIGVRMASDPRIRALILCNSFVCPPRWTALRHLVVGHLFSIRPPRRLLRWLLLGPGPTPDLVELVRHTIRQVPPDVVAKRLRQALCGDQRNTLSTLSKPLLYLRGLNDALVSLQSWRHIQSLRPDARLAKIPGPHLLLQVEPAACWRAIAPFLSKQLAHATQA